MLHICEEHACILRDRQQSRGCSQFSELKTDWPLQQGSWPQVQPISCIFRLQRAKTRMNHNSEVSSFAVRRFSNDFTVGVTHIHVCYKSSISKGLLLWSTVAQKNIPNTKVFEANAYIYTQIIKWFQKTTIQTNNPKDYHRTTQTQTHTQLENE